MALNVSRDDDVIASINIIPFVDIVLVLLIIFMVTSTAIVKAAIKVELPKAAAAGSEVSSTVNLVVTADRVLILDGEELSFADAAERIRVLAADRPALQAVISADKVLPYGEVVGVIDMVKQSGVVTFALNIERRAPAGS
jgi:biopolymer transport protein ExbD